MFRDTSIRPSVERVLKIWQERKVFEKDLVKKLLDNLNNGIVYNTFHFWYLRFFHKE